MARSLVSGRLETKPLFASASPIRNVPPGSFFCAPPGGTIWDAIKKDTPWFEPDGVDPFHRTDLGPGQYYPRIARPIDQHPHEAPGWSPSIHKDGTAVAIYRGQLNALTLQLDRVCRTVHPSVGTLSAYGHDIRNLLILACTEVEAHWRGILKANGVLRDRYTTNDYVKICDALCLNEYAVSFPNFPWLIAVKPFEHWGSSGRPTEELPWYVDYHAVKHDREAEFERATLANAFQAVSACAILMAAQYGHDALEPRSISRAFYQFSGLPRWPLSRVYIYPYDSGEWSATPFPF